MKIWVDGRLVEEGEAKVTVLSPSLNYGFGCSRDKGLLERREPLRLQA
jgi:hypothetical protein